MGKAETTDKEFVQAWLDAATAKRSLADLAKALGGLDATGVRKRGDRLRERGVRLPSLADGRDKKPTDATLVDELNALIDR